MFWIPIMMAAGAAIGAGANIAANSKSPMGPRIKELEDARRRGLLTESGNAAVQGAYGEAARMQAAAQEKTSRELSAMGATSGADVKMLRESGEAGTRDLYNQLGQRVQDERQAEAQELEGRKDIRRKRVLGTLKGTAEGAIAGATAGAAVSAFSGGAAAAAAAKEAATAAAAADAAAAAATSGGAVEVAAAAKAAAAASVAAKEATALEITASLNGLASAMKTDPTLKDQIDALETAAEKRGASPDEIRQAKLQAYAIYQGAPS